MSRSAWWGVAGVLVAVEVAYAFLLWLASPPSPGEDLVGYLVTSAALAGPAALAGVLLWIVWWRRIGVRTVGLDAPARLLAAATATVPADRREWGSAMRAELAQVSGRRERWRFAVGCARAALAPPRGRGVPALAVAALAAALVVGAGVAVGRGLPELQVFAVTYAALLGVLAVVGVSRTPHLPRADPLTTIMGLAGVVACIAVIGYFLGTDGVVVLDPVAAVTLAAVLALGTWLALAPPRALTTSRRARRVGIGVGVAVAGGLVVAARLNDIDAGQGIGLYVLAVPVAALFFTALGVGLADRSIRAGLQGAVWALMATCLFGFAAYVVEASRYYRAGVHPIDGDPIAGVLGGGLHEAVGWVLVYVPAAAVPFAIFGAALALGSLPSVPRRPGASADAGPAGVPG
ncbi:hypothetical protein Bcav_3189 [Beutenbergia cavernae DSM 12333]|uniref:Uncharacterized protein n=1 Tax=Beutenbergia cavernae (strain ATCC BAA-8 / DSM 12333 / CCUG 43141 / JCM 11478 / NBRC 16432 / NCIMB 13614 / HKI 0122) TaxID=471853 RepID=C5C0N7_BEUC1|nr:hypothetical protein [Beutenbergia cavernae]ACQ81433.1 hypothetical protein Bcav_3189 [Beutenbergia cavernae DSM 12333]